MDGNLLNDILDWIAKVFLAVGAPGAGLKFYLDAKKQKRTDAQLEQVLKLDEKIMPDKVEVSSITTQEAARVAMLKAFDAERESMLRTIKFLEGRVLKLDEELVQREELLARRTAAFDELQDELTAAMSQVRSQAAQLAVLADKLQQMKHSEES